MATNELLNVAQAARELNLTVKGIHYRIGTGAIAATKIGDGRTSAYVITREEIERAKNLTKAS